MTVSSSVGPVSGIDYGKLIDGLIGIEQKPIDDIKKRLGTLDDQNTGLLGLSALLTGLKVTASSFTASAVFRAAQATSSNPNVLAATAGIGTPPGSYNFTVQRLASSTQLISQGYADSATTALGKAGNLVFNFGKGNFDPTLSLAALNGGKGVSRGSIRITDRSGAAATVDLSSAVDVNDVVNAIGAATGVNVQVAVQNDKLVITDNSTGTGTFSITNVGTGTTATDLGLTAAAVGNTLTGNDVNKLTATTSVNALNDGNGIRTAGVLNDFAIHSSAGDLNVSIGSSQTLGDVITKINTAGNVNGSQVVTAAISADGHGITLTDSGGGTPSLSALNGSFAAQDLGLTGTGSAGTLTGSRLNAGLNSALLKDLKGGAGISLGQFHITDRSGVGTTVDLSGAKTVADVIKAVNTATALSNSKVTASLNSAGTGLALTDTSGGAANLTVADNTGTSAADLGLVQSVAATTLDGGSSHLHYVSNNTQLSTLNGGTGFKPGQIKITDSKGSSFTVDLSTTQDTTIGAVIAKINNGNFGVKASINANGNGLLLTDSAGGSGTASVQEVNGGTTAASLNILGNFTGTTRDGTQEKTVAILATDKLQDVVTKINQANVGVAASVLNDGSGATPFRLSLVSRNSGSAGKLLFDGSALGINTTALVQGQDAVVLYGNGSANNNLQLTSTNNTLTGVVPGLTVNLVSASSQPVTVSVTQDTSKITDSVKAFVDGYNKVVANVQELTKFDPANPDKKGILFGDSTVRQVQEGLGSFLGSIFTGVGQLKTLGAVGITIGQDGTLSLDDSKLQTALAATPDDVRSLFTTKTTGVGDTLSNILDKFTNAQTGTIFHSTDAIATTEKQLNDRVSLLNDLLSSKKDRLIKQFANLEVNIAQLQQQGSALGSFKPLTFSTSSSK